MTPELLKQIEMCYESQDEEPIKIPKVSACCGGGLIRLGVVDEITFMCQDCHKETQPVDSVPQASKPLTMADFGVPSQLNPRPESSKQLTIFDMNKESARVVIETHEVLLKGRDNWWYSVANSTMKYSNLYIVNLLTKGKAELI